MFVDELEKQFREKMFGFDQRVKIALLKFFVKHETSIFTYGQAKELIGDDIKLVGYLESMKYIKVTLPSPHDNTTYINVTAQGIEYLKAVLEEEGKM